MRVRAWTFELDDKITVFLPFCTDKLKGEWNMTVDRLDNVTYAVSIERSGEKIKVVHGTMLTERLS